jgi:hypothetical protein
LWGAVVEHYTRGVGHDWRAIWLFPAAASVAVLVLFLMTFKDGEEVPVVAVEGFPLEAPL